MIKKLTILALLTVITVSVYSQKSEEKLVRKSFDSYKSSILNDQGEDAVKYVDSRTVNYYNGILELVKNADSAKVESLSLLDKLMVFSIRYRTSREDILSFDGKGLLIYAIKSGMVGKNSVANNSIGEIIIDTNFAKGQLIANGQKAPFYFHFYKEEGEWKIDLTSIFAITNSALEKMVVESEQSENDFLLAILEMTTGKNPIQDVWKKVE